MLTELESAALRASDRVQVVGSSGSGKSTFARQLAKIKGLGYIELDALYHLPDWQPRPTGEFKRVLRERMKDEDRARAGWVLDGNYYTHASDIYETEVTCVVWLDYSRALVMRRVVARTLRRVVTRAELWNGNRESWWNLFSRQPSKSIVAWAWTHHPVLRTRYDGLSRNAKPGRWIRLRSPAEAEALLEGVKRHSRS